MSQFKIYSSARAMLLRYLSDAVMDHEKIVDHIEKRVLDSLERAVKKIGNTEGLHGAKIQYIRQCLSVDFVVHHRMIDITDAIVGDEAPEPPADRLDGEVEWVHFSLKRSDDTHDALFDLKRLASAPSAQAFTR